MSKIQQRDEIQKFKITIETSLMSDQKWKNEQVEYIKQKVRLSKFAINDGCLEKLLASQLCL